MSRKLLAALPKNLFDDTAFYNDWKSKQPTYIYKERMDGEQVFRIYDGDLIYSKTDGFKIQVQVGKIYTFSLYTLRALDDTVNNTSCLIIRNGSENKSISATSNWTRYTFTFMANENYVYVCSGRSRYMYCYIKNIQLEEGTKATDYEPFE